MIGKLERAEFEQLDKRRCCVSNRVVVLVVDEANVLRTWKRNDGAVTFDLFCRALITANTRIRSASSSGLGGGGIIAVFVGLTSPLPQNVPSSQQRASSFPPFVLSQTMDSHWRAGLTNKGGLTVRASDAIPVSVYTAAVHLPRRCCSRRQTEV